ncbi:hypothetical protein TYRP_014169 [Tyrophagus putrescentiae]|nr:hypothetical protein TYRP_014169 [Tyrophagus putrescentiae]
MDTLKRQPLFAAWTVLGTTLALMMFFAAAADVLENNLPKHLRNSQLSAISAAEGFDFEAPLPRDPAVPPAEGTAAPPTSIVPPPPPPAAVDAVTPTTTRSSCSAAATAQGDCVGHLGADGTVAQLAHDGHVGKGHGEGGEDEGEDEVGVHEESLLEDANVIVPTALVVGHIVYHRLDGVDVRYGNGAVHDARNPNDRNDEIGVVLQQAVHLGQGMQCRHVPLNADRAQSD